MYGIRGGAWSLLGVCGVEMLRFWQGGGESLYDVVDVVV